MCNALIRVKRGNFDALAEDSENSGIYPKGGKLGCATYRAWSMY